ncbi:spermatid nuclear transition protein 4-like [Camelus dromedarius]|uniref:Spermatid nuclear transition protein 4 n=1 Tax=Camelus bactrianus TaxID=9837 RepID=A0A9W3ELZ2_CAMBA|nr:spermatid nuclear transition protein 4-like [Camelus bactrianus]
MTKVSRKPQEPRTAAVKSTLRIKGKKTLCQPRSRDGVKVPKTTMKVKRSCQRNSRKKIQTSATQSKKLKKARKPKMVVCYYMLNKKLNQSKKMNQNKRQNQNKGQAQPVPEQETLEKPTTSYNL